ncbi:hypothetical protein QZH41_020615, partial [Actinostola sp. cb2023]
VRRSLRDTRGIRAASPSNNSAGVVVTYHEDKEKAKKAEEESFPPDEIVLGPSIPIILIFICVVASIAWWQFRSDQKERLRYYKEQIRYEEISKRSKRRYKKKKQSLREIRMKKLYGDMTRHWQGTQTQGGSPPLRSSQNKRSFAGRLLELAEKPVSYIRTPRGSRPSSMIVQEQGEPLVVMREKKGDKPAGHHPPSRPASVLLRDALNMIFGATATSEAPKDPGSESDSKRTSLKRVSFYDTLVEKMADVKESEDEAKQEPAKPSAKPKPAPLLIPHIMIRQPSYESGQGGAEAHRKSPLQEKVVSTDDKDKPAASVDSKDGTSSEPKVEPEQSFAQQAAPSTDQQQLVDGQEPGQDSQQPRSFEKKLVEMLEDLQNEKDEFHEDDADTDIERSFAGDYLNETSPPPVPHQTPVPRDSGSSTSPIGKTNCADLEDFLLNLDKELEDEDEP